MRDEIVGTRKMGLLGLFLRGKCKGVVEEPRDDILATIPHDNQLLWADSTSITPDERLYYQPDEYYVFETHPGSPVNHKVVTFEERKASTHPSKTGLYVAEIMLLDYCIKGKYPRPKGGYQGFWWFDYGIRDVGGALKSLEARGYIAWAPKARCLADFKVGELRELLKREGLPTSGKKEELLSRIAANISAERIPIDEKSLKYELTNLGVSELEDNGYVPYMHSHRHKTTEGLSGEHSFTVWDINALFPDGVEGDWRTVVGEIEKRRFGVNMASHATRLGKLVRAQPASAETLIQALEDRKAFISEQVHSSGDGFAEASKGYDYQAIGEDAEALVQFYIAAGKKFDAPAVYDEAASLLQKYGLSDAAVEMLARGLKNVSEDNAHWQELMDKRDALIKTSGQ